MMCDCVVGVYEEILKVYMVIVCFSLILEKKKKNLFSKVRTKVRTNVTGSALVFIFLRTLSW